MASSRIKRGKINFVTVNRGGGKSFTQGQGVKISMFSNADLERMVNGGGSNKVRCKATKELIKRGRMVKSNY